MFSHTQSLMVFMDKKKKLSGTPLFSNPYFILYDLKDTRSLSKDSPTFLHRPGNNTLSISLSCICLCGSPHLCRHFDNQLRTHQVSLVDVHFEAFCQIGFDDPFWYSWPPLVMYITCSSAICI